MNASYNFFKSGIAVFSASIFSANFVLLTAPAYANSIEDGVVAKNNIVTVNGVVAESSENHPIIAEDIPEIEVDLEQTNSETSLPLPQTSGDVDDSANEPTSVPSEINPPGSLSSEVFSGDLFSEYLLGPGDQIRTEIIGYETFEWAASDRVVLSDGSIRLPLIGTVTAAGMPLEQLEAEVTQRLRRTLVEPEVSMSLVVLRPIVVNVAGDVYRPGPVQLGSLTQAQTNIAGGNSLSTTTTTPTLTAALTAAGGIRRTADIRQVIIQRRLANGQFAEYQVNLWDALRGQDNLGVLVMFDGDSVFVPKATADSGIDQALIARSSISPANVRVRVIGEGVVRPGEVEVQPDSSVSSAVAAAGGPNADAALQEVRLVRLSESGQVEEQQINLSSLIDNNQIQDGDVILVPKRGSLVGVDQVARFLTPILGPLGGIFGILNIFGLFDDNNN
jgi:polysaccharide export outer membrane protein